MAETMIKAKMWILQASRVMGFVAIEALYCVRLGAKTINPWFDYGLAATIRAEQDMTQQRKSKIQDGESAMRPFD